MSTIARADPVFVYGNQKSGTSAIAGLIAARAGVSATIDLSDEIRRQLIPEIVAGRRRLESLLRHNRAGFAATVIKHPNLTLLHAELAARFPASRHIFVVRSPAQNIRSILDRLQLAGDLPAPPQRIWDQVPPPWRAILRGQFLLPEQTVGLDYVEVLAERWNRFADCYLAGNTPMRLVRYEDFQADKLGVILAVTEAVGLPQVADISHLLSHQYQPRGANRERTPEAFFGKKRMARIEAICGRRMEVLGY